MQRDESFAVDVGVDLGGGEAGVAEHVLDDAEVGAVFEKVGGEGVAHDVGVDVFRESGGACAFFDDLTDAVAGEFFASVGEEDGVGFAAVAQEAGPGVLEVGAQGFGGDAAEWDVAGFAAFAGDAEEVFFPVYLLGAEVDEFGDAESAAVQHFEDGAVAGAVGELGGVDALEQGVDGVGCQGFRQLAAGAAAFEEGGRVGRDVFLACQEAEELAQVYDGDAAGGGGEVVLGAQPAVVFGQVGGGDVRRGELALGAPVGEALHGVLHGDAVVGAQSAFCGQVKEESLYEVREVGGHAGVAGYKETRQPWWGCRCGVGKGGCLVLEAAAGFGQFIGGGGKAGVFLIVGAFFLEFLAAGVELIRFPGFLADDEYGAAGIVGHDGLVAVLAGLGAPGVGRGDADGQEVGFSRGGDELHGVDEIGFTQETFAALLDFNEIVEAFAGDNLRMGAFDHAAGGTFVVFRVAGEQVGLALLYFERFAIGIQAFFHVFGPGFGAHGLHAGRVER